MTNPYGNEPGHHPDGLGVPGAQGPQFMPPSGPFGTPPAAPSYAPTHTPAPQPPAYGTPAYGSAPYGSPPQGPPPPYGQNPYGPNGGQNPYRQNAYGAPPPNPYQAPAGYMPPPRKSSRSGLLIVVGASVAVLALVVAGWAVLRPGTGTTTAIQPTPSRPTRAAATTATTAKTGSTTKATAPTTSATGPVTECVAGDKITTATFVATVPTNWFCDGDDGDISLSSATYSGLWVDHENGTSGPDDCADQLYDLGTVEALPDESWGGVTAKAFRSADGNDAYGVRCAVVAGQTWYLLYYPHDAKGEPGVRADVTTIMKTWVWK